MKIYGVALVAFGLSSCAPAYIPAPNVSQDAPSRCEGTVCVARLPPMSKSIGDIKSELEARSFNSPEMFHVPVDYKKLAECDSGEEARFLVNVRADSARGNYDSTTKLVNIVLHKCRPGTLLMFLASQEDLAWAFCDRRLPITRNLYYGVIQCNRASDEAVYARIHAEVRALGHK